MLVDGFWFEVRDLLEERELEMLVDEFWFEVWSLLEEQRLR